MVCLPLQIFQSEPFANPAAIEKNVRFVEENLNRAFYPHTTENLESRRAAEISMWMDALAAQYSEIYWIDLPEFAVHKTGLQD